MWTSVAPAFHASSRLMLSYSPSTAVNLSWSPSSAASASPFSSAHSREPNNRVRARMSSSVKG